MSLPGIVPISHKRSEERLDDSYIYPQDLSDWFIHSTIHWLNLAYRMATIGDIRLATLTKKKLYLTIVH